MVSKIERVDPDKCAGCGMCTSVCVRGNYEMVDKKGKVVSQFKEIECVNCGNCLLNCDNVAIVVKGAGTKINKIKDNCDDCEKCLLVCKNKNFEVNEKNGKLTFTIKDKSKCTGDHYCYFVCKNSSIEFEK